ncbi:ATP-binding protein [Halorubrum sp. DTA98]|uniref:ATP-binding protein n=1 Tax=Halorubrum sp. DTA98 TaxID=3402163 RepID=UPI003AB034F3
MDRVAIDGRTTIVLADEHVANELLAREWTTRDSPADVAADDLAAADVVVVTDRDGVDRVRDSTPSTPVVALVDDPTGEVAVDPVVDGVATDPADVDEQVRWVRARRERDTVRDDPARSPSRIERLHASATRLASVRSPEEAYRATVGIVEEVLAADHGVVGVVDGEWVEPVAASTDPPAGEYSRVRVGSGSAGTVVETGEAVIESALDHDTYGSAVTVPVGDDTVLQAVSTESDAFTDADRELAELLASHLEETISRLRIDEARHAERDRMLALFENVPDAAVAYDYVDGEPYVQRVNTAFEETFGYAAETVVGESIDEYILPPDDDAVAGARDLNEKLQQGENVRREVTRRTADGDRHFILHVIPIRLGAENVAGFAIYTDVTDRREREAILRRQNDQLDEFTAIVSHDLRNPLSVANGYLELARDTGDPEYLDSVGDALDRMDELVTDLRSLAREGRVVGDTRTVSLAAIAEEAWGSVDTGDATLVVESDRTYEIDANRVRELFENLFRNSVEHGSTSNRAEADDSVEHGPTGSRTAADGDDDPVTVRVGTMALRSGDASGFYVEDDGQGFTEDDPDRLFESGYSTDSDGTGLGLAISKHIAEAHGWDVRAMTGEDGGARFEFRAGE